MQVNQKISTFHVKVSDASTSRQRINKSPVESPVLADLGAVEKSVSKQLNGFQQRSGLTVLQLPILSDPAGRPPRAAP